MLSLKVLVQIFINECHNALFGIVMAGFNLTSSNSTNNTVISTRFMKVQ
jgi:hypothetical protein